MSVMVIVWTFLGSVSRFTEMYRFETLVPEWPGLKRLNSFIFEPGRFETDKFQNPDIPVTEMSGFEPGTSKQNFFSVLKPKKDTFVWFFQFQNVPV